MTTDEWEVKGPIQRNVGSNPTFVAVKTHNHVMHVLSERPQTYEQLEFMVKTVNVHEALLVAIRDCIARIVSSSDASVQRLIATPEAERLHAVLKDAMKVTR